MVPRCFHRNSEVFRLAEQQGVGDKTYPHAGYIYYVYINRERQQWLM